MNANSLSLNASQREAVAHGEGPLLVVAGPGTGKTRTLTMRIAGLVLQRGVDPESILALTFTNRAAEEMRSRLECACGAHVERRIFIGTFHALALLLLRRDGRLLGFERGPFLYDREDCRLLAGELLAGELLAGELLEGELLEGGRNVRLTASRVLDLMDRERAGSSANGFQSPLPAAFVEQYAAWKRRENAVDFDDLVGLAAELLRVHRDVRERWRGRWRHVFVDEYQDVNAAQVELVQLLADGADSLMAIGDPDQAIYSFRGSSPDHFLRFAADFPGARTLHLTANYRSTTTIVSASDQIIRGNPGRPAAIPRPDAVAGPGLRLEIRRLASDKAEAVFVARRIARLVGGTGWYGLEEQDSGAGAADGACSADDACSPGDVPEEAPIGFGDIAVLYRLNAQAPMLAAALDRAGIPYQRIGSGRGCRTSIEKAVLALARLVFDALDPAAARTLRALKVDGRAAAGKLRAPAAEVAPREPAEPAVQADAILRASRILAAILEKNAPEIEAAAARLARQAAAGCSGLGLLAAAPLAAREDPYAAACEKVTLSTLHAAKGLEFASVFITGMEDGVMPLAREAAGAAERCSDEARAEERRLLFVGMTRARRRLCLTCADSRFLFGRRKSAPASPFLDEISDDLLSFVRGAPRAGGRRKPPRPDDQMSLFG